METRLYTNRYGKKIYLEDGDWLGEQRYEGKGPYQQRNLKCLQELCPHSRVTLDIGANVCMNSIEYAEFSDWVYAWEPFPQTAEMAQMTIDANEIENITLYNCGLGSEQKQYETKAVEKNSGQNHVLPFKKNAKATGPTIYVETLDSYGLNNVDIIKIDVEGFEMEVLQGGEQTIVKNKPIVQVEIDEKHLKKYGRTPQEINDWFLERGFEPYKYNGERLPDTWKKEKGIMDSFFIPKSE